MNEPTDDELMELLRQAMVEDVPSEELRFAQGVHRLISLEAELADVVEDSALVGSRRRSEDVRVIEFEIGDAAIVVRLVGDRGEVEAAPAATEVALETPTVDTQLSPDRAGQISFAVPGGPFRLRLLLGGRSVVTPWLERDPS